MEAFSASFSATNCSYNCLFSSACSLVKFAKPNVCSFTSKTEKSYSDVIVKHSVGQTVVHKPQKQHFDISMSNFAAYNRIGDPSEVCPTRPVALMGSISMQSTGHTLTHLSQTIQSSISLCNWYRPFTGTGIF